MDSEHPYAADGPKPPESAAPPLPDRPPAALSGRSGAPFWALPAARHPEAEAQTGSVALAAATLTTPAGRVDLSGAALAGAVSDPAVGAEVRWVAGWLANFASPHTRTAYWRDLTAFARWAAGRGRSLLELTPSDVAAYKARLGDGDPRTGQTARAPASIARALAAVSSFYRHLQAEAVTEANPTTHVRRPRLPPESLTPWLTRAQAGRLLAAAEGAGARDHALVCLLLLNGLRVSEACAANAEDLGRLEGHRVLRIRRKGDLAARTVLAPRTAGAVDAHLAGRRGGPLLMTISGRRLERRGADRVVRRLAQAAELDTPVSCHSLRHTFVTTARAAQVDLRDVQAAVGHADPRTTMRYDRTPERLDRHPTYAVTTLLTR